MLSSVKFVSGLSYSVANTLPHINLDNIHILFWKIPFHVLISMDYMNLAIIILRVPFVRV